MRDTKFGRMESHELGYQLAGRFEVMHFVAKGRAHTHDVVEVAVCISGTGEVICQLIDADGWVESEQRTKVDPGQVVTIRAGCPHWMEPAPGETLAMWIGYATA